MKQILLILILIILSPIILRIVFAIPYLIGYLIESLEEWHEERYKKSLNNKKPQALRIISRLKRIIRRLKDWFYRRLGYDTASIKVSTAYIAGLADTVAIKKEDYNTTKEYIKAVFNHLTKKPYINNVRKQCGDRLVVALRSSIITDIWSNISPYHDDICKLLNAATDTRLEQIVETDGVRLLIALSLYNHCYGKHV